MDADSPCDCLGCQSFRFCGLYVCDLVSLLCSFVHRWPYELSSFTQSLLGSMLIIIATGFPGAVGQWAPFSLVGHLSLVKSEWRTWLKLFQLAEAILTETAAPHSSDSNRLADTRSPRSSDDQELELFLSRQDSDEEDEDVDELKQNGTLNQLSTVAVDHINEDVYGPVLERGENGRRQGRRVAVPGHRIRCEEKTLSSKAGIILVRCAFTDFLEVEFIVNYRVFTTFTLSFHNFSLRGSLPFFSRLLILKSQLFLVIVFPHSLAALLISPLCWKMQQTWLSGDTCLPNVQKLPIHLIRILSYTFSGVQ